MEDNAMIHFLTINPDTFLWIEDKYGLLYDSGNFTSYRFRLTPQILRLCDKLKDPDNLYSVEINSEDIDGEILAFITHITEKGMGKIHDNSSDKYLISFPPLLNIQHSWERIKASGDDAYCEILPYLTSLTFYIGGRCPVMDYYRQTTYPVCSKEFMPSKRILDFLSEASSPYIKDIRIVFSNIKDYQDLSSLLEGLRKFKNAVTLYVRAEDMKNAENVTPLADKKINLAVLHVAPFTADLSQQPDAKHIFLVTSDKEYIEVNKICCDNDRVVTDIVPIYNGENADFFHDNVFLSEYEILNSKLERRTVFAHMSVNTGFFGKLTFMPDGKAYAGSASDIPIGNINDSIYDLISHELERNTAWRRTRDTHKQCKTCMYRYLCPSPSIYEEVMGIECICMDLKEKGSDIEDILP